MKKLLLATLTLVLSGTSIAQDRTKVYHKYDKQSWGMPLKIEQVKVFDNEPNNGTLNAIYLDSDSTEQTLPLNVSKLDSITFNTDIADKDKGHNKYRVFTMNISTMNQQPLIYKEDWINCFISIDGKGEYSDFSGTGRIRGRGNSTWEWYDKKPYKFKLDDKSKLLGLDKDKDWNLLANYRDVTDMMNVFAFETARYMGMPFTNHSRFVEVFLNGDYIGTYQLTEKIEVDPNRVDIDKDGGVLISFDKDDGPELSPDATDNFYSSIYALPVCVKHPDTASPEKLDSIKTELAELERAIKAHNYAAADSLMDMKSFISILQLHEFLYNVEIDAPRSLYLFKDKNGKFTFGPVWDWDAGYDFDWSDMTTGHTFFTDTRELIYGTDPVNATYATYHINHFFRDLFANSTFVKQYKEAWANVSDSIYLKPWAEVEAYVKELNKGTYIRDCNKWHMTKRDWYQTKTFYPYEELAKMSSWLKQRKDYLDNVIASYPNGSEEVDPITPEPYDPVTVKVDGGVVKVTVNCTFSSGYSQPYRITIPEETVVQLLGGNPRSLTPLNTNGTAGYNTAAKKYGAWFDTYGNTNQWAMGHVYLESDDLYVWNYGCHPDNCHRNDNHTITMQYKLNKKTVNVVVTFNII